MSSVANITAIFVLEGLEPSFVFTPLHLQLTQDMPIVLHG